MRAAVRILVTALGLALLGTTTSLAGYPSRDAGYHSYPEMVAHIRKVAARHPDIVRLVSIGRSHEGRRLWAAEISDQPGRDEGEPEVLLDGLHHAREHLSAEMTIDVLDLLAGNYGKSTSLGRRVTRLVDERRTWVVFMVNPDGLTYDLTGSPYRAWRKNRQPTPGSRHVGTDLNRNYGYRFGCCGASSGSPSAWNYRGPRAWSAPETRALRDFVQSRVVEGRQRIRTHISFHTAGELVLWPYGYTRRDLPPDMTELDLRTLRAMGRAMAASNGYVAKQSSAMYPTDGDMIDWMYARQRVFSFTFELFPKGGGTPRQHYPPDEVIDRETRRNRDAVLYLIGRAGCPYAEVGATAARLNCGPFFDDLEITRGWSVDPAGADTASAGRWNRANPARDTLQLGSVASGAAALVTGARSGVDVDGGSTTVRSPLIRVPRDRGATLRLSWWLGLSADAEPEDGFRVHVVDASGSRRATLLEVSGTGERREPRWRGFSAVLPDELAGEQVAIELEAVDSGADSTVEAGVDQVRVTAG
jgi:murein tripeptide amidase MpaA